MTVAAGAAAQVGYRWVGDRGGWGSQAAGQLLRLGTDGWVTVAAGAVRQLGQLLGLGMGG